MRVEPRQSNAEQLEAMAADLRSTLGKLEIALSAVDEAIAWTDERGAIQWCNREFDQLVELSHIFVLGRKICDVLPLEKDGRFLPETEHPFALARASRAKVTECYELTTDKRVSTIVSQAAWKEINDGSPIIVFTLRVIGERLWSQEAIRRPRPPGKPITARVELPALSGWRKAAELAGLAAVYFLSAKFGLLFASVHPSVTPVWPPTGIALAAFLILGRRAWPAVFAGAFAANLSTAGNILTSLGIAGGNTLEGLAGAWLAARYAGGAKFFTEPRNIFKFSLLAGLAAPVVSATLGVTSLCLGGFAPWAGFAPAWRTWWLGDMAGALVAAPPLLIWSADWGKARGRWKTWEGPLLLAALLATNMIVFGPFLHHLPIAWLCVPALLWTAFQFGPGETAAATLALAGCATWGTLRGFGPFSSGPVNESLLLLQAFLAVSSVLSLAVAAVVADRRRANEEIKASHGELERRIGARTTALERANAALLAEVSERRRAEEMLNSKSEELSRSNAELNLFSSIVAHELQEPLRKIVAFGDLLKDGDAGADAAVYRGKMQDAAGRMQRLVDDMLALSRVTSQAQPLEPVDVGELFREIAADFEDRLAQTESELTAGPLPTVNGDPIQLRQLFTNLVSNAYKFRRKEEPLRIVVSAGKADSGFVAVSVEDNGIGFDTQYRERIFKPFQRLHRRTEYEGSGMGLAICERILLRHGGAISAKSEPGKGSVFTVTIPALRGEAA